MKYYLPPMKKILTLLISVFLISYPLAHVLAHADTHTHGDEFHSVVTESHSHGEHHHDAVESHQDHQENVHQHIDHFYRKSSKLRELNNGIFALKNLLVNKAFLYAFYFSDFIKPTEHTQTTYHHNQPFLSSNQPLLI